MHYIYFMKLTSLTPMLWTEQLTETIDFYTGILGFECSEWNQVWGWASLQNDGIEIMLARPNEHTPYEQPVFTGTFYFRVDDVQALWERIKEKVKVLYPLETFEWGMREFGIYDNNGYMLQFGEEILKEEPKDKS